MLITIIDIAQKMKFSIKDFFSKYDQMLSFHQELKVWVAERLKTYDLSKWWKSKKTSKLSADITQSPLQK